MRPLLSARLRHMLLKVCMYILFNLDQISLSKFTVNLYCICLSIDSCYTEADAVQICGNFWDTQYFDRHVKRITVFVT